MNIQEQIEDFIQSLQDPKKSEIKQLHQLVLAINPNTKVWFENGINNEGKTIANPTIGYGLQTLNYANGTSKDFFQIGISPNTTGISVYILGLQNKLVLNERYSNTIGKAKITGYCIKFKSIQDINFEVLGEAIQFGLKASI